MAAEPKHDNAPDTVPPRTGVASRKTPILPLFVIATIASALGIALGLIIDWWPVRASTQLEEIETVYDVLIVASVPMFVLVMTAVLYCVWTFKMRPGEETLDGPPIHGNTRMEVIWTLIPAFMMLALCTYAYVKLKDIEEAPVDKRELNVRVVGEQFAWTFFYPPEQEGGEEVVSTQLYLPVNRSVNFRILSKDVLHDFWVPAFGMKIDAVPGIDTSYRVTPNRQGSYPVVCAELCGLGHAVMRQTARVVSPENFEKWLAEQGEGAEGIEGAAGEQAADIDGEALFTTVEPSCGACHALSAAGTPGGVGPDLDESLKGKDAAYIERAIIDPDADIAQGYSPGIMPPVYRDALDPNEVDALVDYLVKSTKG